ncbi:MAG TPA: helix-turn-helix domain-containing protein [Chitinophagaceae bacterium]|nr:helix-turn-helix domain-containing protein [Chitinophagaceae bacterium]
MKPISEIIKDKRIELQINKAEMARKLGISSQLYGNYEDGTHEPKIEFYKKWKEVFNQDLLSIKIDDERSEPSESNANYGKSTDPNYLIGIIKIQAEAILKQQNAIDRLTIRIVEDDASKKTSA